LKSRIFPPSIVASKLTSSCFTHAGVQMKRIHEWNHISSQIKNWRIWDWNSLQWVNVYMKPLRAYKTRVTFLFQTKKIL